MEMMIKSPLEQASIGQAIVAATRPRSCMAPILFGLGVDCDHAFGSKWLINDLNRLGFSVSVDEVTCFKQSVLENENISEIINTYIPGSFTQWSADNVDHNVNTLDGTGSLHGMGIICSTTNEYNSSVSAYMHPIKRQKFKKGWATR